MPVSSKAWDKGTKTFPYKDIRIHYYDQISMFWKGIAVGYQLSVMGNIVKSWVVEAETMEDKHCGFTRGLEATEDTWNNMTNQVLSNQYGIT